MVKGLPEKPRYAMFVITMVKAGTVYVDYHERWTPVGQFAAYDAKTGTVLWIREGKFSHNLLPFENAVWGLNRDNANKGDNMEAVVLDPRTGEEQQQLQINGHVMGKCWGERASASHILCSGGWYLDRETGDRPRAIPVPVLRASWGSILPTA